MYQKLQYTCAEYVNGGRSSWVHKTYCLKPLSKSQSITSPVCFTDDSIREPEVGLLHNRQNGFSIRKQITVDYHI